MIKNSSVVRQVPLSINEQVKEKTIQILNKHLADISALALLTKQAHWNMRGSNFIGIHEMLDPMHKTLLEEADQIAERIVQLGGIALGTPDIIAAENSFKPYPLDISHTADHLAELSTRYAVTANNLRKTVDEESADMATVDILTQMVEDLDKYIWFIEAHLTA
ncbi:MAG: DNA starvation/stationary phase protection protein Dps [Alphaproteobacteria bacterium]